MLCFSCLVIFAQESFKISGKVKALKPFTLQLSSVTGETLGSVGVGKQGTFELVVDGITPDLYILHFGKIEQPVYLMGKSMTINGFMDEQTPKNSALEFTGIDNFYKIMDLLPTWREEMNEEVRQGILDSLRGTELGAMIYLSHFRKYEPLYRIWELLPQDARQSWTGKWLRHQLDSLESLLTTAYNFTLQDSTGKKVSLSDFRGKLVMVDFWASWCGPCRQEMKRLLPIYDELRGEDLVFISISLDKRKKDWIGMIEQERLPWIMLWDEEGFALGDKPNTLQREYNFYAIPFIVLIDKTGRIIARELRGEKVKEAIEKARKI